MLSFFVSTRFWLTVVILVLFGMASAPFGITDSTFETKLWTPALKAVTDPIATGAVLVWWWVAAIIAHCPVVGEIPHQIRVGSQFRNISRLLKRVLAELALIGVSTTVLLLAYGVIVSVFGSTSMAVTSPTQSVFSYEAVVQNFGSPVIAILTSALVVGVTFGLLTALWLVFAIDGFTPKLVGWAVVAASAVVVSAFLPLSVPSALNVSLLFSAQVSAEVPGSFVNVAFTWILIAVVTAMKLKRVRIRSLVRSMASATLTGPGLYTLVSAVIVANGLAMGRGSFAEAMLYMFGGRYSDYISYALTLCLPISVAIVLAVRFSDRFPGYGTAESLRLGSWRRWNVRSMVQVVNGSFTAVAIFGLMLAAVAVLQNADPAVQNRILYAVVGLLALTLLYAATSLVLVWFGSPYVRNLIVGIGVFLVLGASSIGGLHTVNPFSPYSISRDEFVVPSLIDAAIAAVAAILLLGLGHARAHSKTSHQFR